MLSTNKKAPTGLKHQVRATNTKQFKYTPSSNTYAIGLSNLILFVGTSVLAVYINLGRAPWAIGGEVILPFMVTGLWIWVKTIFLNKF